MHIRPSEPEDLEPLVALLSQAFTVSSRAPFLSAPLMRWKYWDAREDWTAPRSYVVEHEGRLLAHTGIWPCVVPVGGGLARRGVHLFDWAADPAGLGAGSRLLQHMTGLFDFVYGSGGEKKARAIFPLLGLKLNWTTEADELAAGGRSSKRSLS